MSVPEVNQEEPHKHTFKKAFKKDTGVPGNENYTKGPRFLLMWVCTGCDFKETYDLTHKQPGGNHGRQ